MHGYNCHQSVQPGPVGPASPLPAVLAVGVVPQWQRDGLYEEARPNFDPLTLELIREADTGTNPAAVSFYRVDLSYTGRELVTGRR